MRGPGTFFFCFSPLRKCRPTATSRPCIVVAVAINSHGQLHVLQELPPVDHKAVLGAANPGTMVFSDAVELLFATPSTAF
jgi:hypothetical protein